MPLLLLLAIAVLQWLVVSLLPIEPPFDQTVFFAGNLQIIVVIWVYQTITKYIKF